MPTQTKKRRRTARPTASPASSNPARFVSHFSALPGLPVVPSSCVPTESADPGRFSTFSLSWSLRYPISLLPNAECRPWPMMLNHIFATLEFLYDDTHVSTKITEASIMSALFAEACIPPPATCACLLLS